MNTIPVAAMTIPLLLACGQASRTADERPRPEPAATARLIDASGSQIGIATLTETAGTLRLALSVAGLPAGVHGMHLHAAGRCTPPGFESAGDHFNPEGRKHGARNPDGPHAGDLPNLRVEPDGSADTSFTVSPDLVGSGPRSVFRPEGTALVIHAAPDDEVTDPSGNSGDRIACGAMERS